MGDVVQFLLGLYFFVAIITSFVFWATLTSRYEADIWRRIRALGLGITWPYTIAKYSDKKEALQRGEAKQVGR